MSRSLRPFVGRTQEVDALDRAAAGAESGRGSTWLVVGEAGIGKSRLVEEAARRAEARGLLVAWGRAWESGGAPAFWPWVQVLRTAVRRRGAEAVGEDRAAVLAQLAPDIGLPADPGGTPRLAPDEARFRLLDAVVGAILDVAEGGPLCVVLEDLHVADQSSLLVLELLASQARTSPLLVIATHREVTGASAPGADELLRLARTCTRLPLPRLDRDEVAAFVRAVLPGEPPAPITDAVYAKSEGSPLFVVELAQWFSDPQRRADGSVDATSRGLPGTIRALIEARVVDVPAPARALLDAAAVLGRQFALDVLAELAGREPTEVSEALAGLCAAGVLETLGRGELRFSHVLVRDVLYGALADDERQALHVRCADARLARHRSPEPPWSELAHHLLRGGAACRERAIEAAVCAGERAMDQLAFDEAVAWLGRALDRADAGVMAPLRRAELQLALARARMSAGDLTGGRALCSEVAAVARETGDARLLARGALQYGGVFLYGVVNDTLIALLTEAHEALRDADADAGLRATVLARLAAALQPAEDPSGPIEMAQRAVALARTVGDPAVLLGVMRSAGSAMADLAPQPDRLALDREHLGLARRLGDTAELLTASQRVVFDALEVGDRTEAAQALAMHEDAAATTDVPHVLWRAAGLRAMLDAFHGRFDAAADAAVRAGRLAEQAGAPNATQTLRLQRILMQAAAGREADEAMPPLQEPTTFDAAAIIVAGARSRHRRPPQVPAELRAILEMDLATSDLTLLCTAAEIAIATEQRELAATMLERLEGRETHFVNFGMLGMFVGEPVALTCARLHVMLGNTDRALDAFAVAQNVADRADARAWSVWARFDHATFLARVRPAEANRWRPLAERALAGARTLGMTRVERELGELLAATPAQRATPVAPPTKTTASPRPSGVALRRIGDVWEVSSPHGVVHLRDTKGLRMLAILLDEPGRAFHVLDLVGGGARDTGDAGPMIDTQARDAYRRRVRSLRAELDEAESWNDPVRADNARAELEALEAELSRTVGLGGRPRRDKSATERARVNVQRRLRDVVRRLAAENVELGREVDRALRTGTTCAYEP